MKKIFFFTTIILIFSSFKKGEPVAILKCKSASGRTLFEATVPSGSYIEKAIFSIDGSSITFNFKDRSDIIFDPEDHVFTMYIEKNSDSLAGRNFVKFWAIPKTFKQTVNETGPGSEFHDVYEFRAIIFGTEPRKGYDYNSKEIELFCTLDYEL